MGFLKNYYLSLGSNMGDKINHLQDALYQIVDKIGNISKVSPVYKTKSWGFEADDFYNIAILVQTNLTPNTLINKLLEIENKLGRIRNQTKNYESRIIDIDILFSDEEIINTENLVIPHPQIQFRRFVLQPLHDIASDFIHPISQKTIEKLLENCEDNNHIELVTKELDYPISLSEKYNFIAIEGNIGAGKTSLANLFSEDFNAKKVLERFADNPFLPKFYKDTQRYALPTEMSFLADRYQQLSDDLAQFDLFKSFIVSDYYIFKSLIFSQVTLPEDEFKLYRKIFDIMYKEITKPDLYIYLYQNTKRLLENIKKRGREYEQNISEEYLQQLQSGYLNFIQAEKDLNVLIIDVSEMDFVNNEDDYCKIIREISLFDVKKK